jgi:hypothetical protein
MKKHNGVFRKIMILVLVLTTVSGLSACKAKSPTGEQNGGDQTKTDPENPGNESEGENQGNGGDSSGNGSGNENKTNLPDAVVGLPEEKALSVIWSRVTGSWTSIDGLHIEFSTNGSTRYIDYGASQTDSSGFGELTSASAIGPLQVSFIIHFSAMPATEQSLAQGERDVVVMVDLGDIDHGDKIRVLIDDQGAGVWYEYTRDAE